MENKNNTKIIITLLIIIICILVTFCILLATGIINFKSNSVNDSNQNINDNNQVDEGIDITKKFKLENNGVNEDDLNEVFDMLGLYEYYHSSQYSSFNSSNECLNNYISQDDFRKNSKEIFAWYSLIHNMKTDTGHTAIIRDVDDDGIADVNACGGAADCGSIRISDANKIIDLYKLTGMEEYLDEMPEPYKNAEYLINYYTLTGMHPIMCNIESSHNLSAKYDSDNNLIITDEQNVTEYGLFDESEQVKSQDDKSVTYTFKKDSENKYYLDNVSVE